MIFLSPFLALSCNDPLRLGIYFSGGIAPAAADAAAPIPQADGGLDLEADTSSEGFHLAVDNFNVCIR